MKKTEMRTATLGDLDVNTYLHDDGTHSIGLIKYGSGAKEQRYLNLSLHLTGEDFDALIKLLNDTRAESRRREVVSTVEAIEAT